MSKTTTVKFEAQTVTVPSLKRGQTSPTPSGAPRNNTNAQTDEKKPETERRDLVNKLIGFLETT